MSYFPNAPDVLTVDECAALIRVCTKQVRKMIHSGDLDCFRISSAIRIPKVSVEAYIETHLQAA